MNTAAMNPMWMVAFGVVAVLVFVVAIKQNARQFPYVKAGPVLSPAERRFFFALLQALAPDQMALAKIRVADLIKVKDGISKQGSSSRFWKAFSQISQKHVDFVVVDRGSFDAKIVIELDDASHSKRGAREGDAIKDKAFAAAGLPLVRIKAAGSYEPNAISVRLLQALAPPAEATAQPKVKAVAAFANKGK